MEIPDYDDLYRIEKKVDELSRKFDLLINNLDIPKYYQVSDKTFNSKVAANEYASETYQHLLSKYSGGTGCIPLVNLLQEKRRI